MQNIPAIDSDNTAERYAASKTSRVASASDKESLFEELFKRHSDTVENGLALSPVTNKDKMVASVMDSTTATTDASNTTAKDSVAQSREENHVGKASKSTTAEGNAVSEEKAATSDAREQRMTQEDFDKVKDDLKEYGLSKKEISELEDKVNSEEGMTWNELVSTLAAKMAAGRKVTLGDAQKADLSSFFSKLGFSDKQSAKLISQIEKGESDKVMKALKAQMKALGDGKQLLLTHDEVTAFTSAMQCSDTLASKIQSMLGQNATGKDMKAAFTMLNKEMTTLDAKDQKLVKAVGKAFAAATGKEVGESSAAKDIQEAVDLKPRVAENGGADTTVKEDLKQAMDNRRDNMAESNAKHAQQKGLPKQAESQTQNQEQKPDTDTDSDKTWKDFFGKLHDDSSSASLSTHTMGKTENAAQALSAALTDSTAKSNTVWEKVNAPKVLRQVQNAVIKTMSNGAKQLTLQLAPENLGKLSVSLQVNGKEVSAVIKAESHEAAKLIHQNVDVIKQALQDQGLKVDKMDVQTGLTGDYNENNWFGQNEHNMARDREAMAAMRNHMRAMRTDAGGVDLGEAVNVVRQVHTDGLHIVA
ncbi:flagellar hook-length control protein FliK [Pseudodesulfovibrio sp.]|uniref:flagellar hook-length control protein FliK n=1 Tax=unclassified Pseudodesulfovibrio TaxID=2661612 RepID=UPI003AFFA5F5